jgi:hypothetical protein
MARYTEAIRWIAENDDTEWLDEVDPIASVTACLVADVFGKGLLEVTRDLRKAVVKAGCCIHVPGCANVPFKPEAE